MNFEKWYLQEKGEKPSFNRDHNGSSQWDGDKYDAQSAWQASAELSAGRIAELEAKLAIAIEALVDIKHSMTMAKVIGNDKQREISLSLNISTEALAKIKGE